MKIHIGDICILNPYCFDTAVKLPEQDIRFCIVLKKRYFGINRGYTVCLLDSNYIPYNKLYVVKFNKRAHIIPCQSQYMPNLIIRYPPNLPVFSKNDVATFNKMISAFGNMDAIYDLFKDKNFVNSYMSLKEKIEFYSSENKKDWSQLNG